MNEHAISSLESLEALYGSVMEVAIAKEIDYISEGYRKMIEAAPFVVIATVGTEGVDCSPRGDPAGFVRVVDEKTLVLPDRRGNNRIDSMRNIIGDPRVALMFMIPGMGEVLRVIGQARITVEPQLLSTFAENGKEPISCLVVNVEKAYFQCTKAIIRSKLWDPAAQVDRATMPTAGSILAEITRGKLGGLEHDRRAADALRATLY